MNRAASRFWDFPSALLLLLALLVAGQRLAATGWTPELGIASLLALFGAALGLPLGLSRFRRGMVLLFSLIHTLVFVPFTLAWVLYPGVPWLERMAAMGGRLVYSFGALSAGQPLEDTLVFLVLFALIFWLIGLRSSYALTRAASFTAAVLPGGLALILLQILDAQGDRGVAFMAVYLFLALFLLGRMNYAHRNAAWRTWHVLSPGEARTNINLTVLAAAFLLVAVAWAFPVSPHSAPLLSRWWQSLTNSWQQNDRLANLVAGLETTRQKAASELYEKSLSLGQDAASGSAIIVRVKPGSESETSRHYWRVRSYDIYQDGIWKTSNVFLRNFLPGYPSLQLPVYEDAEVEFTFRVEEIAIGSLVTPAQPVWVSRPSSLAFLAAGDEQLDPVLFRVEEPILPGEEYAVRAIQMELSIRQLQVAGEQYPDWVLQRYLQLPDDLPPAIAELARRVTVGAKTPYDKAVAITQYLRNEITYNPYVPPAPVGRDTLAWFLLDHKSGFCNYYATAEVVMLRAVGVPARLAVGFAQGEYQRSGWYTVRQRDAHAWPEVYFPRLGWVEFEPTSTQPELVRPSGEYIPPTETATEVPVAPPAAPVEAGRDETAPAWRWDSMTLLVVYFVLSVLFVGLFAWLIMSGLLGRLYWSLRFTFSVPAPVLARDWLARNSLPVPAWLERRAWLAGLSPLARAFMTVYRSLRQLKIPASPTLTPAEAAAALTARLPHGSEETAVLLHEYQSATYGTARTNLESARQAAQSLRRKTARERRQNLLKRYTSISRRMDKILEE